MPGGVSVHSLNGTKPASKARNVYGALIQGCLSLATPCPTISLNTDVNILSWQHARPHTIAIKLQLDTENIIFSIADDGQGFDPQTNKKGMGFSNMSNRAGLFAGKVEIDSGPGQGCAVTVNIPLTGSDE